MAEQPIETRDTAQPPRPGAGRHRRARSRTPPAGCWSSSGVDGLALRAVAREMGMTAPALYRYFSSREDLVENVVADIYDELTDVLETVRDAADPAVPGVQLLSVSRAFRQWATTHHAEFGLLFGSAAEPVVMPEDAARARRAAPAGRQPALRRRLRRAGRPDLPGAGLPGAGRRRPRAGAAGAAARVVRHAAGRRCRSASCSVFLSCWIRLYGMVCMEVFGHLRFALDDAEPMFEAELQALGRAPRRGRPVPAAVRLTWANAVRDEAHC